MGQCSDQLSHTSQGWPLPSCQDCLGFLEHSCAPATPFLRRPPNTWLLKIRRLSPSMQWPASSPSRPRLRACVPATLSFSRLSFWALGYVSSSSCPLSHPVTGFHTRPLHPCRRRSAVVLELQSCCLCPYSAIALSCHCMCPGLILPFPAALGEGPGITSSCVPSAQPRAQPGA